MKQTLGFTLIELIIVLALVAILSVYMGIQWNGDSFTIDATSEQLARDIRYTQSLAMNRHQRFRINLLANQYQIFDGGNNPFTHPAIGASIVSFTTGVSLTSPTSNIIFDTKGSPYQGAGFPGAPLAAPITLTLNNTVGDSRQIIILPETGKVTLL